MPSSCLVSTFVVNFFIVLSKVVGVSCLNLPSRCCNLVHVVVVKSFVTVINSFSVC